MAGDFRPMLYQLSNMVKVGILSHTRDSVRPGLTNFGRCKPPSVRQSQLHIPASVFVIKLRGIIVFQLCIPVSSNLLFLGGGVVAALSLEEIHVIESVSPVSTSFSQSNSLFQI